MDSVTMGIDLASKPEKTAVCLLAWGEGTVAVLTLCRGRADEGDDLHTKWLSTTGYGIRGDYGAPITKIGIDAPFGWPEPFMDAVAAYRASPAWPTGLDNSLDVSPVALVQAAHHARALGACEVHAAGVAVKGLHGEASAEFDSYSHLAAPSPPLALSA